MNKTFQLATICCIILTSYTVNAYKLKRIISRTLTASDYKALKNNTELIKGNKACAVAIIPTELTFKKSALNALALLEGKYKVKFKTYFECDIKIPLKAGNYIFFANGYMGSLTAHLAANWLITNNDGYEVRNIPNVFKRNINILYFGGRKATDLVTGMKRFIKKIKPDSKGDLIVGKYYDLYSWNKVKKLDEKYISQKVDEIKKHYASLQSRRNLKAVRLLSNIARKFNHSGDEIYAKAFFAMLRIFWKNYEQAKSWRKTPPSFRAHELALALALLDQSSSLTIKDHILSANVLRKITEDCLNYWEMTKPIKFYNEGKTSFFTNHSTYAAKSISAMTDYLTKKFSCPATEYWSAVSLNVFKGSKLAAFSPEDGGLYQWLCKRTYIEHTLRRGSLPHNSNQERKYIEYAIANINQMGVNSAYGDTPPLITVTGWSIVKYGKLLYNDSLAEYVLSLMKHDLYVKKAVEKLGINSKVKYTPRMNGLSIFPVDSFLKKYYKAINTKPILNKAVFRNGYNRHSEYLMIGGMNTAYDHGHRDANAIIQYSRGDRYWLVDGDGIKCFPREHNSLIVSRDATIPEQRRVDKIRRDSFAEIDGSFSSPDCTQAITVTSLRNYNGVDWTRYIFWNSNKGFWVIDRLKALSSGYFVNKIFWRTLGKLKKENNNIAIKQKVSSDPLIPSQMELVCGDNAITSLSEQYDHGHSGPFGYYATYPYSDKKTKIITRIKQGQMQKNQEYFFAHFFLPLKPKETKPKLVRVGSNAWITNKTDLKMVISGKYSSKQFKFSGKALMLDKQGLCAIDAKFLSIAGRKIVLPHKKSFYCKWDNDVLKGIISSQIMQILTNIYAKGKVPIPSKSFKVKTNDEKIFKIVKFDSDILDISTCSNKIMCSTSKGKLYELSASGNINKELFIDLPVTKLLPLQIKNKKYWIFGTSSKVLQNAKFNNPKEAQQNIQNCSAKLGLLDNNGKLLWQREIPPFRGRPGTVTCLTSAILNKDQEPAIIAGSEGWAYYAYSLDGKMLWKVPILHAAVNVIAADTNNNGVDEIALATEYYNHYIVNNKGQKLKNISSTPGDITVKAVNIPNGKKIFVFGREDGFIKAVHPEKSKAFRYSWETNIGGMPTGIALADNYKIAVSTSNNAVVFLNSNGVKQKIIYMPAYAYTIVRIGKKFYIPCRDGYIYKMDLNGNIQAKIQYSKDNVWKQTIHMTFTKNTGLLAYGKTLNFFKL